MPKVVCDRRGVGGAHHACPRRPEENAGCPALSLFYSLDEHSLTEPGSQQGSTALQASLGLQALGAFHRNFNSSPHAFKASAHTHWASSTALTLFFKAGFLPGLELIKQSRLVGQRAPRICLYPPSQHWDYKLQAPNSTFSLDLEDWTRVLTLAQQALYQLNYLPSRFEVFWKSKYS